MKRTQWIAAICFGLLMMGLGASDALRGIYSPVFQERYALSEAQLSQLLTVSYLGNLLFLGIGGKMLDRFGKKAVMTAMMCLWGVSMLLNAATDQYGMILVSVFMALGASTLLNTSVNLATPLISARYAGLLVNIFFFIQGVGTSLSQFLLGRFAFSYAGWRGISLVLFAVAAVCIVLFLCSFFSNGTVKPVANDENGESALEKQMPPKAIFWLFAAMMGCYFIAEHGIMNRLMSYCLTEFEMPAAKASALLSIFWAGMTAGRLVFAPVVYRLGCKKSILLFGGAGTVLFCAGCVLGQPGLYLLAASGLALSVLYPTMLLFLQELYPVHCVAAKTGAVISIATVADIVFNAGFGFVLTAIGYRLGFLLLPLFLVLFYGLYWTILNIAKQRKTAGGTLV